MAIELKYWDGRGLMEVPRMILALAGKFPGDYTDGRYHREGMNPSANAKPYEETKDALASNLGRLPVMDVGGTGIGQSAAINYYLATTYGFMGKDALEGAQITAISEHLKEMGTARGKIMAYGQPVTEELQDQWFNTGAEDKSPGPADASQGGQRNFKWYCGRIEYVLGEGGYAVGGKLSLADLLIYDFFAAFLPDEQSANPDLPKFRKEAQGSLDRVNKGLEGFPKIKAICDKVANEPNIKKWLETRPKMNF